MITVKIGDLFTSDMATLANTVNCEGIMGKGIALNFKKKYPEMYEDYKMRCLNGEVEEGVPYVYEDLFGNKVLNFPTKNHWKNYSNLKKIEEGLDSIIENYQKWGLKSLAFPPLGCGNGGLSWLQVGPLMYQKLSKLDIPIEIYAPWGTEEQYLTEEFLRAPILSKEAKPLIANDIPGGWFIILEILYELQNLRFTRRVGKTIFQKICYFVTYSKVETSLSFHKGNYGPYSREVQELYNFYGRENLISVDSGDSGDNIISVQDKYLELRERNRKLLENNAVVIDRVVDLFRRVKSAQHAEILATIVYVYEELSKGTGQDALKDTDVYNNTIEWKKQWDTPEKKITLIDSIRHLSSRKWIKVQFSPELDIDDF
ncbi:MAG: macro domain-containing protein [Candidatus Cloacimonadia bacterium]